MELGGNAPFLVFADADLDAALDGAMIAKMRNGGEACTAANRFYVEAADRRRVLAAAWPSGWRALRVGPGVEESTQVGPLVNEEAVDKVDELVARCGRRRARRDHRSAVAPERAGCYYAPTVLTDVPPGRGDPARGDLRPGRADRRRSTTRTRRSRLANDTEYGLVAYVYTGDLARGLRVSERIEAGMVGLNRGLVSDPAAPFGGVEAERHRPRGRPRGRARLHRVEVHRGQLVR